MTAIEAELESAPPADRSRRSRLTRPTVLISIILAGILFYSLTSPRAVPSILLIAGFIVLGVLICAGLQLGMQLTGVHRRLSKTYRRVVLVGGTALPVMLFMLQSIGQLTLRDVLTLCGLFLMGLFYVSRVAHSRS